MQSVWSGLVRSVTISLASCIRARRVNVLMIPAQRGGLTIRDMTERDDPLLTAAERTREAEERFVETTPEDPAIVPKAHKVYQRAEEVSELAKDAAEPQT